MQYPIVECSIEMIGAIQYIKLSKGRGGIHKKKELQHMCTVCLLGDASKHKISSKANA